MFSFSAARVIWPSSATVTKYCRWPRLNGIGASPGGAVGAEHKLAIEGRGLLRHHLPVSRRATQMPTRRVGGRQAAQKVGPLASGSTVVRAATARSRHLLPA